MSRRWLLFGPLFAIVLLFTPAPRAAEPGAVERGRKALLGRAFNPAVWSPEAYGNAWRAWGKDVKEAPLAYSQAFMERYGLHPAPYANGKYPMGLREAKGLL